MLPQPQLLLLVAPRLLAGAWVDVAIAHPLVSNMGSRPPVQSALCWDKHSHVSVFTVPTKVQERTHKPNLLPGRAHLSPNHGHERRAGLQFMRTRGRAGTRLMMGTRLTVLRL